MLNNHDVKKICANKQCGKNVPESTCKWREYCSEICRRKVFYKKKCEMFKLEYKSVLDPAESTHAANISDQKKCEYSGCNRKINEKKQWKRFCDEGGKECAMKQWRSAHNTVWVSRVD